MRHKKRFGQNFLQDFSIIEAIVQAINPEPNQCLIEIGPGAGALTKPVLTRAEKLISIEIDTDWALKLSHLTSKGLTLISADALTVDYKGLLDSCSLEKMRLIGNLPYNVATPLMLYLLNYLPWIEDAHFMVQKEVALRLAAAPGSREYGRLSIMMQYYNQIDILFDVPPEAFYPKPKVDSAVVRIRPHVVSPYSMIEREKLESLTQKAFGQRRKTLKNNLKTVISSKDWETLEIDASLRPEMLDITTFVRLAKFLN